ncbi:MAG: pentapeptide repeat-containing protein, partial [Campylobacter sp.]|nr:pentapeptide repeat-containing protein [Campylobacter sp.]
MPFIEEQIRKLTLGDVYKTDDNEYSICNAIIGDNFINNSFSLTFKTENDYTVFKDCTLIFENCTFKINKFPVINKNLKFSKCIFEENIKFNVDFLEFFECKDCAFMKNAYFINATFGDAYFNNSLFDKLVDFHESTFKNTACFYGVDFRSTPNFSAVKFNNTPNFINAKFNFDCEKIKSDCECEFNRRNEILNKYIKKIEKQFPIDNIFVKDKDGLKIHNRIEYWAIRAFYDENINKQSHLNIQIYNDFRASFELLKKIHNDSGNSIDALNHHKAELYCKEMALEAEFIKKQNKIDNKKKEISKTIQTKTNIRLFFEMILHCLNLFFKAFCHTILAFLKFLGKKFYNAIHICFKLLCTIVFVPILVLGDFISYLFSTKKCAYTVNIKRKATMLKRAIKNKFEKSKNNQKISNLIDYSLLNIYRNTSNHHTNLLLILNFTVFMIDIYMIFWLVNYKISSYIANHFFNNISFGYFVIFIIEIM